MRQRATEFYWVFFGVGSPVSLFRRPRGEPPPPKNNNKTKHGVKILTNKPPMDNARKLSHGRPKLCCPSTKLRFRLLVHTWISPLQFAGFSTSANSARKPFKRMTCQTIILTSLDSLPEWTGQKKSANCLFATNMVFPPPNKKKANP